MHFKTSNCLTFNDLSITMVPEREGGREGEGRGEREVGGGGTLEMNSMAY